MASKLFPYQNNFNTGEVSPRFDTRSDVDKYYSALKRLINFLPFTQGGVTRRPGLRFGLNAFCDLGGRIIPFKFTRDVDSNFLIHLCDEALFITDDGGVNVPVGVPLGILCEEVVDDGIFVDPLVGTCAKFNCDTSAKLNFRATGGVPPYSWSVVNVGADPILIVTGVDDRDVEVNAPTNLGAAVAGVAWEEYTCAGSVDINNCKADLFVTKFGCDGLVEVATAFLCGCSISSCPNCCDGSPTFCDGAGDPGPCNGCFVTYTIEDQLRGISPCGLCGAVGMQCIPTSGPGCDVIVDVRTGTQLAGNCNPCEVAIQDAILTVTDSVGQMASFPLDVVI